MPHVMQQACDLEYVQITIVGLLILAKPKVFYLIPGSDALRYKSAEIIHRRIGV